MKGVPAREQEEYGTNRDDCWRCGRPGLRTYECFSFNTKKGTILPPVPWKAAVVAEEKRKQSEEPEDQPAAKQQRGAAVDAMEINPVQLPHWMEESDESDF